MSEEIRKRECGSEREGENAWEREKEEVIDRMLLLAFPTVKRPSRKHEFTLWYLTALWLKYLRKKHGLVRFSWHLLWAWEHERRPQTCCCTVTSLWQACAWKMLFFSSVTGKISCPDFMSRSRSSQTLSALSRFLCCGPDRTQVAVMTMVQSVSCWVREVLLTFKLWVHACYKKQSDTIQPSKCILIIYHKHN